MFDEFSKRSKAVRAALELAQQRDWGDITLGDIARQAGLDLADLRREFACKSDILRAFQAEVDAEVLAKAKQAGPDGSVRDRLFDIIMTRFEVMGPYKPALKRIACYLRCRPGEASLIACSTLASQYWMLAGAGAKLGGARGGCAGHGARGDLRQGLPGLARRPVAVPRQDHGRARPRLEQWRANAG